MSTEMSPAVPDRDHKPTVLVVDDQPANLLIAEHVLSECCRLLFASGGGQALGLLESEEVDLVLLDLLMPGLDGYEVCRRIKANERTRGIPVIFLTVAESSGEEEKGLSLGAVDYVTKPVKPSVLRARVHTHVQLYRARQALARHADELELRVLDRTRELRAALGAAEAASRAKEEILRNTSHELRTPLNGIIGMLELLQEQELGEDARLYTGIARDSAAALSVVLNDILDFAKADTDVTTPRLAEYRVDQVLEDMCRLFGPKASEKQLELGRAVAEDVALWQQGDVALIRQVLIKLIDNACKFTHWGAVHLRTTRHVDALDRNWLRWEVRDTGIGIADSDLPRLFKPFIQLDGSAVRQFGGMGLGLANARNFVHRLEGQMGVASTPGAGSTFWFEIPYRPLPV